MNNIVRKCCRVIFGIVLLWGLSGTVPFLAQPVLAQVDPIQRLAGDHRETPHFEIWVERSNQRPTVDEVAVLAEAVLARLEGVFGSMARHEGDSFPRGRIFIVNDKQTFIDKSRYEGVNRDPGDMANVGGFYIPRTRTIILDRKTVLQSTRETLLHEIAHYYTLTFLPGGPGAYPSWFHESMAELAEKHTWDGRNLQIGVLPRVSSFDQPRQILIHLERLRAFIQQQDQTAPVTPIAQGRNTRTPINPEHVAQFFNTQFSEQTLRHDRVPMERTAISERYALYFGFGRFLAFGNARFLNALLVKMKEFDDDPQNAPPVRERFAQAWSAAAEVSPLHVEDMIVWWQRNQLPFEWIHRDWQDYGTSIGGRAESGRVAILLFREPTQLFVASPVNSPTYGIGVVVNYHDRDNYSAIYVDERGVVTLSTRESGRWMPGRRLGDVRPAPSYHFALAHAGRESRIQINNFTHTFPAMPGGRSGFYLRSAEATFTNAVPGRR